MGGIVVNRHTDLFASELYEKNVEKKHVNYVEN